MSTGMYNNNELPGLYTKLPAHFKQHQRTTCITGLCPSSAASSTHIITFICFISNSLAKRPPMTGYAWNPSGRVIPVSGKVDG